jgi:predicted Zn-dependent peptidase
MKQTRLSNGLAVVAVCLPHLHTTAIVVRVRAGSRYETPKTNGISHFVEHMLFRGNHNLGDAASLPRAAARLGGTLEAHTSLDEVKFKITVAPDRLDAALSFLGTFFAAPCFHDVEVERALVLEEMEYFLDPDGKPWNQCERVRQLLFVDHPLGLPPIGCRENVRAFRIEDVREHFSTHYTGSNIVVGIAGPCDVDAVLAAAERHIDVFEPGNLIQSARYVPGQHHPMPRRGVPSIRHLPNQHAALELFVTFTAIPGTIEDALALNALRRAVGGGLESLLYAELSQRLGLVYAIDTTLDSFSDVHLFETVAFVQPDRIVEVLCRVLAILATVRREGVDEELLDIVKAQYRVELLSWYNDSPWLAAWAAGRAGRDKYQFDVASYEAIMNGFTPDTLRDAAQRLMVAANTLICAAGALDDAEAWKLGWYGAATWVYELKRSASPHAERAAGGAVGV